jgi:hypothetical protein
MIYDLYELQKEEGVEKLKSDLETENYLDAGLGKYIS